MVAFNTIPGNILVPFWYAEINSGGSPYEGQSRLLLAGQKTAAGSATAGVPVGPIQSEAEAIALFGNGSMLHHMYLKARRNAPFQPIWTLPLADPAGAAATGTITLSSAPGGTGVAVLRVLGRRLAVQVLSSDTVTLVAAALAAAINGAGLPVTATAALGVVTLTARHVGTLGNGLAVRIVNDEPNVLTAGNTAIVALAGGTGVPDLITPLANLGDDEFDWIAAPYADSNALNTIRDFLSGTSGRWSPTKQLYGHYITANFGTLSSNVTLGNSRNDRHVSIMASQISPSPVWEWAAALGGQVAAHLTDAPELSRPLQTLILDGILPPDDRSVWWDIDDRQALYVDGMSGYKVTVDGQVAIDRVVTTEQVNAAGAPDATFRDIETIAQMMFTVRYMRTEVANRHARQALADENPFNVAEVATPASIRNTLVHAYRDLVALGVTEKPELFAEFVQVERDGNNATRVNAYIPVDVVNQLRVFAANVTTFLQYRDY
jgi:phage tail sheath gpL-like